MMFVVDHLWEIIFAVVFAIIIAAALEGIFKPISHRFGKTKALYDVVWKKPSSLKPEDLLGLRGKPERFRQ